VADVNNAAWQFWRLDHRGAVPAPVTAAPWRVFDIYV
jgi:hypothetical protein